MSGEDEWIRSRYRWAHRRSEGKGVSVCLRIVSWCGEGLLRLDVGVWNVVSVMRHDVDDICIC